MYSSTVEKGRYIQIKANVILMNESSCFID